MHTDRKGKGNIVLIFKNHDYAENPKKFYQTTTKTN